MSKSLVLHQKYAILRLYTNEIKHPTIFLPQIRLYLFMTPFYHPNTPNLIQTKKNKKFSEQKNKIQI